jgi:hypothetical protein
MIQYRTHDCLANWHPHLHLLVTDGGFRPVGTFGCLPLHDVAALTEAFRSANIEETVQRKRVGVDSAQGVLAWLRPGSRVPRPHGTRNETAPSPAAQTNPQAPPPAVRPPMS